MKTCPNCAKEVPDYTNKCKYCDHVFSKSITTAQPTPAKLPQKYWWIPQTCSGYMISALAILALASAIFLCVNPFLQPKARPAAPTIPSEWRGLAGHIWTGVKVYYGDKKNYGFTILGVDDTCPLSPSGKGVRVKLPDGTQEWKDRSALLTPNFFFNISDPNKDTGVIGKLECP